MNEVTKTTDIDKLIELAKENTLSTRALTNAFLQLKETDVKHTKAIEELKEDVNYIKNKEEITDAQAGYITSEVKRIAREATGYPSTLYRYAIHDIYKHLTERWNMGNKVRTTTKGNFQNVVEGLRTYKPNVESLKNKQLKNEVTS